jgi:uracil-DNA glycosylase family 4
MERLDLMEQIVTCENCVLHTGCAGPVFMSGPAPAEIVVLGEAPGKDEDKQGAPFVGPAGKLMRRMLADVGIQPDLVAFVNTVSCLPNLSAAAPTPEWEHLEACAGNKAAQIEFADPDYVLTVGKTALKSCRRELDMHARGRPWLHNGRLTFSTYHPSAALRNGNYEQTLADDLIVFKQMIDACASDRNAWVNFIPASCSGCSSTETVWFEGTGLGWCDVHVPDAERELLRHATERSNREYAEAKERSGESRPG